MGLSATPSAPEGADIVMVKPGLPFLDITYRVKGRFGAPTFAYQVSGEYAMLMAAVDKGFRRRQSHARKPIAFKRAGADAILMFCAPRGKEADGNGVRRLRRLVKPR